MPRRRLLILGGVTLVGLAATLAWWARGVPGAGALHQFAPTTVKAGELFEIKVLAGVWGEGQGPQARYRDWTLQLLQGGEALGAPLRPTATDKEGERLVLRFRLTAPGLASASRADLTWQLRFVFDGLVKQVDGPHAIAVQP